MKGNLERIEKRSAEQQALASLRSFILSGHLTPGERLTEAAIAGHLGVSRATIRTGMHRLVSEGILIQIPYTGWQVATITAKDAWELWTLRGSLEGLAAQLVCQSTDDRKRNKIQIAFDALKAAVSASDIDTVNDCDFNFHRTIVELAEHSRLLDQYIMVENQIRLYIEVSNKLLENNLKAIIKQHAPLTKALLESDATQAQFEAWNHNFTEGQKLVKTLQRMN